MNANSPENPPVIAAPVPGLVAVARPKFKFLLVAVVWLSVVLMGVGVTLMLPEMFASAVRLKVLPDPLELSVRTDPATAASLYDPRFFPTQSGLIYSEAVLSRVVNTLDLPTVWGNKYYEGQKLKTSECVKLLEARLDVRARTNANLIDIRAFSESSPEAALVANAVAKAYAEWRLESVQERLRANLGVLEKELTFQDQKIAWLKQDLAKLAEAGEAAPPNSKTKLDYLEKQKRFETELGVRESLLQRVAAEGLNLRLPRSEMAVVVEAAVPGLKPVRPNVTLNIVLSIILGGMFGLALAGIVFGFQSWAYQRKSGVYGNAHSPGLRNTLRVLIGLGVGMIAGYNCAVPLDAAGLVSFPLLLTAGGVGLGFVELANSNPLPPRTPPADEKEPLPPLDKY